LHRHVVDFGCGDGVNTIRLCKALQATSIVGYDINYYLIKRARKRGIPAYVKNIEEDLITGVLGILWGVLHHLREPEQTLLKLKQGFNYLIIREKINKTLFELGKPFDKDNSNKILYTILGKDNLKILNFNNLIIALYSKEGFSK